MKKLKPTTYHIIYTVRKEIKDEEPHIIQIKEDVVFSSRFDANAYALKMKEKQPYNHSKIIGYEVHQI